MRIKFFIVCVLEFVFSAVASTASREIIKRNTVRFQEYNKQYEKSELFKKDRITEFNELREEESSSGIIIVKRLSDLTISFLDNAIDSMLKDNGLEPCLFIKCRWGAELLSNLVEEGEYDDALVVENFLLSKMNEAKLVPVFETPFDLETPVLDCMNKTNTPALNKYMISPYKQVKQRFFKRLQVVEQRTTIVPPINVTYELKKRNQFWYVSNLVVGSEIIRKNYLTEESNFADLFRVHYSILNSFSFNNMFDLVSAINDSSNDLVKILGLSEVFVGSWHKTPPGFWAQTLGGIDDPSGSFYRDSYLIQSEEKISTERESPLGSSEELAIDQYFAGIPESGVVLSNEDEERWNRISKKLFTYYEFIPNEVTNRERKKFILYLKYNKLGYDLGKLTRDESGGDDKEKKQKKMQQQLEEVRKDYYNTVLSLMWMPYVQRNKYFRLDQSSYLFFNEWSLHLDNSYENFEKSTVSDVIKYKFDDFHEILIEQVKSKKNIEPQELMEFIEITKKAFDVFVGYDYSFYCEDIVRKMKEILKTVLHENLWEKIELFEQEMEKLVNEGPLICLGQQVKVREEWRKKCIEKLDLIKTKIDGESDPYRLLVEKAKLIIAENMLHFAMLKDLNVEIYIITSNIVGSVPDFTEMLTLLEYVANYVESSSRISDQMKVLFKKLNESSLIYINEQLKKMLTRSVNKELLIETQKILQEEMAKRNGEEIGF